MLEEAIPSSSRLSNTRGLPPKDVLDFLFPGEINLSCLKLAVPGPRIGEELLKLDEQRVGGLPTMHHSSPTVHLFSKHFQLSIIARDPTHGIVDLNLSQSLIIQTDKALLISCANKPCVCI